VTFTTYSHIQTFYSHFPDLQLVSSPKSKDYIGIIHMKDNGCQTKQDPRGNGHQNARHSSWPTDIHACV